ncbi:MAG: class I SAM-dependent methyltransferase [Chloroflexi bacterium]|nr:class I SAM-dependent methyltransferase [Chloroflexota bacterium]
MLEGSSDMEKAVEGGYHWQSGAHANEWLATLPAREPERAPAFEAISALIPAGGQSDFEMLDLGAGAGALAAVVLRRFPLAKAVLADFSEPMINAGHQQLAALNGRYRYVRYDMNAEPWPGELAGPYLAVISSQAIHHLPDPRKAWLFRQVYEHLVPGGLFANWDPYRTAKHDHVHSPGEDRDHPHDHQHEHDRTLATVEDTCQMLQFIGFERIEVSLQTEASVLISARKP